MTTNNGSGSRIVLGALDVSSLDTGHTGHTARLLILILSLFPLGGEQTFSIGGVLISISDGESAAWRLNCRRVVLDRTAGH